MLYFRECWRVWFSSRKWVSDAVLHLLLYSQKHHVNVWRKECFAYHTAKSHICADFFDENLLPLFCSASKHTTTVTVSRRFTHVYSDSDRSFGRIFMNELETFLETAPQTILQLYIFFQIDDVDKITLLQWITLIKSFSFFLMGAMTNYLGPTKVSF